MSSARILGVVFDAVGTLIHPEPPAAQVYGELGARFGSRLTLDEIVLRFGTAFRKQEEQDRIAGWRTSEARERERWRAIVGSVLDDVVEVEACFQELFEYFSHPQAWCCDPEAAAILEELAGRHFILGLASNFDGRLRRVLTGLPALRPIHHLAISSEIGWRKPAPGFFEAVCRLVALAPDRILHVGDDPANDYQGAQAAGLQALLLDPRGKITAPLPRIAQLSELITFLPRRSPGP